MTNLVAHITRRLILPVFVSAVIFCAIILSGLSVRMPMVSAASTPQILISPSSADLSLGQTFTMTINLTDFPNLFLYQVVFKYNGAVLNLTNLWFPDDNVFSGQNPISLWSNATYAGDTIDHLNYTVAGSTLLSDVSVSVSNGVLCKANFTVVGVGQTTIEIATKNDPAYDEGQNTWYTYCEDQSETEFNNFVINTSSIICVPEFTPIVLVMTLAILGTAILITRKKRALLQERRTVYTDHAT